MKTSTADASTDPVPEEKGRNVVRWLIIGGVAFVSLLLLWLIGSAVIPRWWAQRMGDAINGRLTTGTFFGLTFGAAFTVLPLAVLAAGWKFRKGWKRFVVFVVAAAICAFPNLATLGIVLGSGNAAHAGERILDVDGPGFRGGSLVGAILGVLAFAGVSWLLFSRRRNKRAAKSLKAELADRAKADAKADRA